jgi:hypothetical protein
MLELSQFIRWWFLGDNLAEDPGAAKVLKLLLQMETEVPTIYKAYVRE